MFVTPIFPMTIGMIVMLVNIYVIGEFTDNGYVCFGLSFLVSLCSMLGWVFLESYITERIKRNGKQKP